MYCWKNIDGHFNADGEKELSDARTGFTRFILLNQRPPDGCLWSGVRLTRKQTTSRPDNVWPDVWKHLSDAAKSKANKSGPSRNQSSIMSDTYMVSSSLFALETIRTSAMRVIHITVKTEETQRLRIKFVLYCIA